MVQITARLPDALRAELDAAAPPLNRCRADVIRSAIEYYLDDIEDLRCGVEALKDPTEPVLNLAEVRDALLAADTGSLSCNSHSAAKALAALLCESQAAGSALKGEFEGLRRLRVGRFRLDCLLPFIDRALTSNSCAASLR
jgi:RHH-type rel operon transcriptional repressor/antitoxin RelB